MGLDRVPEVRCSRQKLKLLTNQNKSRELNNKLIDDWYGNNPEDAQFLYIDGHNRVYYGTKANLPVKYISRQKLCLSATSSLRQVRSLNLSLYLTASFSSLVIEGINISLAEFCCFCQTYRD
jgi:hypothetical protein